MTKYRITLNDEPCATFIMDTEINAFEFFHQYHLIFGYSGTYELLDNEGNSLTETTIEEEQL